MRSRGVFWVLPRAFGDGACCGDERTARLKIQGPSGKGWTALDLAGFCRQPERLWRDPEKLRGLAEVQPGFDPVVGGL